MIGNRIRNGIGNGIGNGFRIRIESRSRIGKRIRNGIGNGNRNGQEIETTISCLQFVQRTGFELLKKTELK